MHIDWFVFIPCVLCNQGADDKVIGKLIVVIIIGELLAVKLLAIEFSAVKLLNVLKLVMIYWQ